MCLSLLGCGWPNNKNYKWADAKSLVEYAASRSETDSDSNETSVSATIQQTGDTQTTDKQAAKKEDGNKIDLKYLENNRKNKKIRKNFLESFTINIGNFF